MKNRIIRLFDKFGLDDHHWLPKLRDKKTRKSSGQSVYNLKCPDCPINIESMTQKIDGKAEAMAAGLNGWGKTPHGFLTFTFQWNKVEAAIRATTFCCCDYLLEMSAAITLAKTTLLAVNSSGYFRGGTSYTDTNVSSGLEGKILECCGEDIGPLLVPLLEKVKGKLPKMNFYQEPDLEPVYTNDGWGATEVVGAAALVILAAAATVALVSDDVTGVGIADDAAIPPLWAGVGLEISLAFGAGAAIP